MNRKISHYWYRDWLTQRSDLVVRNDLDRFPIVLPLSDEFLCTDGFNYNLGDSHPDADITESMVASMVACGISAYAVITEARINVNSGRVTAYDVYVGFRTKQEAMMFKLIQAGELAE